MKKLLAPIIITVLALIFIVLYAYGIITAFFTSNFPIWLIILICSLFVLLICALIFTLYKRILEIKEEKEDDLSKY